MTRRWTSGCLGVALSVWAAAATASAQEPGASAEARALFEAGRAAYDSGRFREASDYFERCHALTGAPDLLYNAGRASQRAGDAERAVRLYGRFLATSPPEADRAEVEAQLSLLRAQLEPPAEDDPAPGPSAPTEPPVVEQWWLWTLVAVGVLAIAGVAVGVGVGTADPGREAPIPGDVGPGGIVVALTLEMP